MNQLKNFTFKAATASERMLIHYWLKQDYIRQWIHGIGLENTLAGLEKFIQCEVVHKETDRNLKLTQHWMGYDGSKPVVYLLTSNIQQDEESEYAKYATSKGPLITLDIFIGNPEYVGKGLAPTLIREFLLSYCKDVAEVFIDPEQNNQRAVHVYQKTGFHIVGEFIASWHPVPHYVMKLSMKELRGQFTPQKGKLIVFGGLPGAGKTTISKKVAERLQAVYLRVDTIEQALKNTESLVNNQLSGPEGYLISNEIAKENLSLGLSVVADSVNPIAITREWWHKIAQSMQVELFEIEIICSDKEEHKRRVEGRTADIIGHKLPTWEEVKTREYEPWNSVSLRIDTAQCLVDESVDKILKLVRG